MARAISEKIIELIIYDYPSNTVINRKQIKVEGGRGFVGIDINNPIQYNQFNGDIFFVTKGRSLEGQCLNEDSSCHARIYKTNINNTDDQKVIFQSKEYILNWVLDKANNQIYLIDKNDNFLKKIDFTNEQVTNIRNYSSGFNSPILIGKNNSLIILDQKYLLGLGDVLIKNQISLPNGLFTEEKIESKGLVQHASLSPDGKFIAFIYKSDNILNVYSFEKKKTKKVDFKDEITNINMVWSLDDQKIYTQTKKGIGIYNTQKNEIKILEIKDEQFPLGIMLRDYQPSEKILYKLNKIFDFTNNKEIDLPAFFSEEANFSDVLSLYWF